MLHRETQMAAATEWAWRPIGGTELWGMELPLWAESVWSYNEGLGRRTGGMDGWWMGKKDQEVWFGGKNFGQQEEEKSREADVKDLGRR
jgi:hypothetical protein